MSFSFGGGLNMGPRGALESHGEGDGTGRVFDSRIVRRLLGYLRPYARQMAGAFVMMVIATALTLLIPYLTKIIIDQYIAQGDLHGLNRMALVLSGALVGIYVTSSAQQYLLTWVGQRVLMTLRNQLFEHLQRLSLGYHDTHIAGVTISRVISDVSVINDLLSQGLVTLVGDSVVLVGIVVVMVSMSPRLALLAFAVLPLMVLATWLFTRRAQAAFRDTRARVAAVVGDLAEDITGMRVIQAFAQEGASEERFDRVNAASRDAHIGAMTLSFVFLPTVEVLGMLATAIVLWFGGRAVGAQELTLGVVVAFLAYVSRFFQPIQELSQLYTTMQSAMAGGERVLELLDAVPAVRDAPDSADMPPIAGLVEFREVTFAYREGEPVLHEIDLTVAPGQTAALVGPTGAGKTSMANLVARLYDVTEGAVLIDGIDVRSVTQASLRRQFGLAPQDPIMFSGTIAHNVRFGRPEATDAEVEAACRLANAHPFIERLPAGYATEVFEGGINLSAGERQLISIARAVLSEPRILILDEATSSVDTVTEVLIQDALERLLEGRTAFVIAHRLSTIRRADLICVIDEGRIVERGTHEELLALGGLYRDLYERQFLSATSPEP